MRGRFRIFAVLPAGAACYTASCSATLSGLDRSENETFYTSKQKRETAWRMKFEEDFFDIFRI